MLYCLSCFQFCCSSFLCFQHDVLSIYSHLCLCHLLCCNFFNLDISHIQLHTSLFASFVVTLLTYLCQTPMEFVWVWQDSVTKYVALVAALFSFASICIQHELNYILINRFVIYSCQMYLFWLQRNSLKLRQLIF